MSVSSDCEPAEQLGKQPSEEEQESVCPGFQHVVGFYPKPEDTKSPRRVQIEHSGAPRIGLPGLWGAVRNRNFALEACFSGLSRIFARRFVSDSPRGRE